jgi:hypothetical protein
MKTPPLTRSTALGLLLPLVFLSKIHVAQAHADDYGLQLDVQQVEKTFVTQARFQLPLRLCQAWQYIIDYDAALNIPGIIESRTTRLSDDRVRVHRVMKERILFFPIHMHTVMEFKEMLERGTDFVQLEGEAKSHKGSWRLEAKDDGTVFHYNAVSEPDSALPMAVIQYFVQKRLQSSFAAMAQAGAIRKNQSCTSPK